MARLFIAITAHQRASTLTNEIVVKKEFKAMGGLFEFCAFPQNYFNKSEVEVLFNEAASEVARIEAKFTEFKQSPFNEINRLAGVKPCQVDSEIMELIVRSIALSNESHGIFDITSAVIGQAWREAKKLGRELSEEERKDLRRYINYKKIIIDQKSMSVFLPNPQMRIGLGGIGKGYAVDMSFELLKSKDLYNFSVNGSGDLRFHSHPDAPRKWRVGIQNPFSADQSKVVGVIQVATGAVATSGSYKQFSQNEHHIINPHTGHSQREVVSATILADTCVEADTTATIVMNMNGPEALNFLNKKNIFGALITNQGQALMSESALKNFGT